MKDEKIFWLPPEMVSNTQTEVIQKETAARDSLIAFAGVPRQVSLEDSRK